MKHLFPILTFFFVFFSSFSFAQQYAAMVELVEEDKGKATFRVETQAEKKKEAEDIAAKALFYTLFYNGVEGFGIDDFNIGTPLIEKENKYYVEKFLANKYKGFVIGSQLEGEPTKDESGLFKVYAIVQINKEALIRDLKINKIIEDDEIKEKTPQDNITPKRKLGY